MIACDYALFCFSVSPHAFCNKSTQKTSPSSCDQALPFNSCMGAVASIIFTPFPQRSTNFPFIQNSDKAPSHRLGTVTNPTVTALIKETVAMKKGGYGSFTMSSTILLFIVIPHPTVQTPPKAPIDDPLS